MYKTSTATFILALATLILTCLAPLHADDVFNAGNPALGKIEMPFIVNQGQLDDRIVAFTQTACGKVYVKKNGDIAYLFSDNDQRGFIFEEHADGAECNLITFEDKAPTKINYFKGSDRSKWRRDIPAYHVINLGEIYDGITLKLKAHGNNIEKLFYIAPGADPNNVRLNINEAENICVNTNGELEVLTEHGVILFTKPIAYQNIQGIKKYRDVEYRIDADAYGFKVNSYDPDYELTIDPLLASTYLGGSSTEGGDSFWWVCSVRGVDGDIYVAGMTLSDDFPTAPGAYEDTLKGNYDLFISRLSDDLSTLVASTYLGGSNFDQIWSLALDDSGNVYISGTTHSSDFPTTPDAYDKSLSGTGDAFISKFDADLTTLKASTYLGGYGYEFRPHLAINSNCDVYIGGTTDHNTFPWIPGAYDNSYAGNTDFFVSKFNSNLMTLQASTFLGGTYREDYPTIQIDDEGNVFLCGTTGSHNYPWTSGAYDTTLNGSPGNDWPNLDICVSKLSADLSTLLASTFVGAGDYESGLLSCLDQASNIYVAGHTWDADFPVTAGVLDEGFSGDEYHIVKLDNNLSSLLAATFITPDDAGLGYFREIASDQNGYIYVVGATDATDFPIFGDAYDPTYNGGEGDGFLMKIDNDMTSIAYSTYLGGSGNDGIRAILFAENEDIYLIGYTNSSSDFPILPGAYDDDYNGGNSDCFAAKFTFDQFTRITEGPHVTNAFRSSGVCLIDYNNDNYLDIYETNARYPSMENNCLYENNGDGTFSQIFGLDIVNDNNFSTGAIWADYDNDNDLDVLVHAHRTHPNLFYLNNGDGSFTLDTSVPVDDSVVGSTTASWIDYNNDGDIDLFIGNATCGPCPEYPPYRNFLFENTDGVFSEITGGDIVTIEKHTYGASWCDYDNDGDVDLIDPNKDDELTDLFRNEGNGVFTHVTTDIITTMTGNSGHSTWADYDNDGDMDLFLGGNTPGTNHLYNNNGDGTFSEAPDNGLGLFLGRSDNGSWVDYDNDGDQDILVWCNIYEFGAVDSDSSLGHLFENNNGVFTKLSDTLIFSDSSLITALVWGDYDRDGDLDLYVPMFLLNQEGTQNLFYINNGNSNNWVTIKCVGTNSNRSAIGAKVRLKANIFGSPIWQMREITSQIEPSTQPPLESHFGLGDASIIDSIKIEWPSGMVDVYTDVNPDQFITYTETVCGDADGNANVNLLDITYLIYYLYKDGPAPVHMQAADPDGNGITNILDITYMILYLYKGGPDLVCQ